MGQELTIAQGPRIAAPRPRDPASPRIAPRADGTGAAPAAAAPAALAVVDVSWSAVAVDPEEVIATLHAERAAARAGFDHPHAAAGCSFCRRAAAFYR